jgi:hypothetical protein
MVSMSCATFAWGCWWTDLVMQRFVPDLLPSIALVATIASLFAGVGLICGFLSLRGKNRLWLAIAVIPILANASLLATPFLLGSTHGLAEYREQAPTSSSGDEPDTTGRSAPASATGALPH